MNILFVLTYQNTIYRFRALILSFILIFSGDQNYFYFLTFEKVLYNVLFPIHVTLSLSNSLVIILTFIDPKTLFLSFLNDYCPELQGQMRTQDLRMDCSVVQRGLPLCYHTVTTLLLFETIFNRSHQTVTSI